MTKDTIKAAYQIARESIFIQIKSARDIDTKISIIAGFNLLLLILCWQIYPNVENISFFLGVGLLFTSFVLLLKAYKVQGWVTSPNPQTLIQELEEDKEIEDIYLHTIGNIGRAPDTGSTNVEKKDLGAYVLNEKQLQQKARRFNISAWILFFGLILMGISRITSFLFLEVPSLG